MTSYQAKFLTDKFCNTADHHIKHAEINGLELYSTSSWKPLIAKLQRYQAKEFTQHDKSKNVEPTNKKLATQTKIFQNFCSSEKDVKRLIINLFPYENGYSIMMQDSNGLYVETMQMPYSEYEFLDYIDNEQIPPMLVKLLDNWEVNIFYSGCVIAQIHDYRIAASLSDYDTFYVLLQPTQQTFLDDINEIALHSPNMAAWSNDDKLLLESYLLVGTSEPLCLDPSPTVSFIKNRLQSKRKSFQTHSFKRHMKRNCANARNRIKEKRLQTAPPPLELHDFIQKYRANKKRNEKDGGASNIRLSKDIVDLWRKEPLDLPYPTKEIEVHNYAKALAPRPASILDSDLLEIQQIHLKSDGLNRDVYSLISILQRPSDMSYFGKLQSNKYFQQASIKDKEFANSCRFSLGAEKQANLYILQYQELFTEDGRRPATVKVNRPLQPSSTKYQIPLLQQPWQLEQEQSLYSVGSVNNIPVKHWSKLKVNQENTIAQQLQQTSTKIQQQQQQQNAQQQQNPQQQAQQQSVNPHHSSTTPTLNAITLQPTSQSAFMFPIPRKISQSQGAIPPRSPQMLHNIQSSSAGRILQQRLSSSDADTLSLISNQDGNLYQLSEASNIQISGRRSRQGSHIFTLSQPGNGTPTISPRATPVLQDDGTTHTININNKDGSSSQDRPLNILPLVTLSNQQQPNIQVQHTPHVLSNVGQNIRLASSSQKQSGSMMIRMPVSINNAQTSNNRQITATFNLLGNGRNVIQSQGPILGNFQQIQLTPGGRVTIPANQITAGIAMQLAAAANQLPGEKSGNGHQQFSISNSGISQSTPITIVSNNNQNAALQNKIIRSQQQQPSVVRVQHQQFKNIKQQQGNLGATITLNPTTQILATNVGGAQDQQPLQLLQVGSKTMQQVPIRPQILLNNSVSQQFHEIQTANNFPTTSSSKPGRNRKRKSTSDQSKS